MSNGFQAHPQKQTTAPRPSDADGTGHAPCRDRQFRNEIAGAKRHSS